MGKKMLYWPINTTFQCFFPIVTDIVNDGSSTFDLLVVDNVGNKVYEADFDGTYSPGFVEIYMNTEGGPETPGEYTYTLRIQSNNLVISSGVMVVGGYTRTRIENESTITYEQYNGE